MPRVRRRLFNVAAAISLALAVFLAALWVDSNFTRRGIAWVGDTAGGMIISESGCLLMIAGTFTPSADPVGWQYEGRPIDVHRRMGTSNFGWFRYRRRRWGSSTERQLLVPLWFVQMTSLLPAALVASARVRSRVIRARRRAAGQCPGCGYDLRATPGRCPECGRMAEAATEWQGAARERGA